MKTGNKNIHSISSIKRIKGYEVNVPSISKTQFSKTMESANSKYAKYLFDLLLNREDFNITKPKTIPWKIAIFKSVV